MPVADLRVIQNPARLEALHDLQLLDTPPEAAFDRLTRLASHMIHAPVALITLVDAERLFVKSSAGVPYDLSKLPHHSLSHSFCQHVVATGQPLIINDSRMHPLVWDNPAITDFRVIAYAGIPLRTTEGHILGSMCVVDHRPHEWTPDEVSVLVDLTEAAITEIELRNELNRRARVEDELRKALVRERELTELKNRVVSMASHELRTPLAIIQTSSDLLRMYGDRITEERRNEHLTKIEHQVDRLRDMLQDVLSIAKTNAVGVGFEPEHVPIHELCRTVIDDLASTTLDGRLRYTLDGLPTSIYADPKHLRQILTQLLSNALKYSPENQPVSCDLHVDTETVTIAIRDSGIGISEDDQPRIFEHFFRASNVGEVTGTGLGLAIARQAVELHGGTITCESVLGQGTIFTVRLPIALPVETLLPPLLLS